MFGSDQRAQAAAEAEAQRAQAAAEAEATQRKAAEAQAEADRVAAAAAKAAAEKRHAALVTKYGAKTADDISNHSVSLGMTKDQVLEARGEPVSRQLVPPNDELWKYGADQVVITSGRVSYIGH